MQLEKYTRSRKIDDFEKLEFLGRGSFGEVRKVRDKYFGQVLALKKIKFSRGKEIPISARREIDFLKKIQHENVVKLFDVVNGRSEGKIYLLVEYCEKNLSDVLEDMYDPFTEPEIKCILSQLFSALKFIHEHFIIHRDINPANILFRDDAILKICDFGSAKEKNSVPLSPEAGTLWYRAPELLLGSDNYDTAVDMWASGCVFAEILTLKPLFPGNSEIEQINLIIDLLGTPNEYTMPGFSELPVIKSFNLLIQPNNYLGEKFGSILDSVGMKLLQSMFKYGQAMRITASECLASEYMMKEPCACSIQTLKASIFGRGMCD